MTINPSLLERFPRLIPDDSSTWCMMMCSSQTMEVRPLTSFPTVQSAQMMVIVKWYIHSHIHSHSPIHTLKINKTQNSPNLIYSASSPLPLLLLSNVVVDIREGFYRLLLAGLLQRPSHLRQNLKKQFVDVFNKNSTIHKQHCPF